MRRVVLALFSLLILPVAAHADTFNISVAAGGVTGTGTLNGTSNGDGSYTINSISNASFSGTPFTVVLLPKNDPYFGSDNLFFPANPRLFDVQGLTFAGTFGVANLFSTVSGFEVQGYDFSNNYFDFPASVNLLPSTATPEPSGIVLSLTGFIGAAATALRRRKALVA